MRTHMDVSGLKYGWLIGRLCEHRAREKGEKERTQERSHHHLDLYRNSGTGLSDGGFSFGTPGGYADRIANTKGLR